MSIGFDDALRIARKSIGDMTGDMNPEVLRFESQDGFDFRFRTVKGNYDIAIDRTGAVVGRFVREDATAPQAPVGQPTYREGNGNRVQPPQGGLTQQAAVEKALSYVGGGRVDKVKPSHGGWEIEISRGMMKGRMKVKVEANGTVYAEKHSRMDMLDFDFD